MLRRRADRLAVARQAGGCAGLDQLEIAHPRARFRAELIARFPHEAAAIDRWFEEADAAIGAANAMLAARGLPAWLAAVLHVFKGKDIARFARRTVGEALGGINDPWLRAVLGARGGNYGTPAFEAPLLEHALVSGAYEGGAWYPVGGPDIFAKALVETITAAGGSVLLRADVRAILLEGGHVAGVSFVRDGQSLIERSAHVISTMGVLNTLDRLPGDAAPT